MDFQKGFTEWTDAESLRVMMGNKEVHRRIVSYKRSRTVEGETFGILNVDLDIIKKIPNIITPVVFFERNIKKENLVKIDSSEILILSSWIADSKFRIDIDFSESLAIILEFNNHDEAIAFFEQL